MKAENEKHKTMTNQHPSCRTIAYCGLLCLFLCLFCFFQMIDHCNPVELQVMKQRKREDTMLRQSKMLVCTLDLDKEDSKPRL